MTSTRNQSDSDIQRLRDIEAEHAKLKRMYAELAMENHALKDPIAKNVWSAPVCKDRGR